MKVQRKGKKYWVVGQNFEAGPWKSYSGAYKAMKRVKKGGSK